jgi:hypothetical protein
MHPLLISLLDTTANWLDGVSHTLRQPALRSRPGTLLRSRPDGITPSTPLKALHNPVEAAQHSRRHALPLLMTADCGCTGAGLRLGRPAQHRSPARHRSAPHDVCLTVISGRMNEVCELLDQLVAREAMHS